MSSENPLRVCADCGEKFSDWNEGGRGRPRKYCESCRPCVVTTWREVAIERHEWQDMLAAATICAACGKPFGSGRKSLDHCHDTNEIRGIVHPNCNGAMGLAKDDPDLLRRLADYLENPNCSTLPKNEIHFSPDADLDWWLNMLDLEVVFEPEPEEEP